MNKLITAIALTMTLVVTQACSSLTNAENSDSATAKHNPQQDHHAQDQQHGEHGSTSANALAQILHHS